MSADVPEKGLQFRTLARADGTLELSLAEVDVPEPGPGEALVKELQDLGCGDAEMNEWGDVFATAPENATPMSTRVM